MLKLSSGVSELNRIGERTASHLRRLDIITVENLLWHLPSRYEDLSEITPIAELAVDQTVTVRGIVDSIKTYRSPRKKMMITDLRLSDGSGTARAVWFHQPYLSKTLTKGDELYLSGKTQKNLIESHFINPVYEKVRAEQLHTGHIVPYYPLTDGITQKQIRFLIHEALKNTPPLPDELPEDVRLGEHLPPLDAAVRQAHFPKNNAALANAIRRLKFEELFWIQLGVGYARKTYEQRRAPRIATTATDTEQFIVSLPFILTADQHTALDSILKDIAAEKPMNRLLQGDVGSGKTVVAAAALGAAARAGYQALLMAPTEILAVQHYEELRKLLPGAALALLTAQQHFLGPDRSTKKAVSAALADGSVSVAVGTHALIQKGVSVPKVALVIIDEQHRFGVKQREHLTEMSELSFAPHLLSLSATPIPRTLALTLYGDLGVSTLREKPKGRKPVITRIIPEQKRADAYSFIRQHSKKGEQTFILCPLIEDSAAERKSVLNEYERLKTKIFPDHDVRFVHGKLGSDEKKQILSDFKENRFPVLVATSVIEVGIDIPNATIMVIEGAERFGLAQLHQFRGRVGRNDMQSYCLLFTEALVANIPERLKLLCREQDGFVLAEADLKLRGEGQVFGTQQSGISLFKIATLRDTDLIERSRRWVDAIVKKDSKRSYFKKIKKKLTFTTTHRE